MRRGLSGCRAIAALVATFLPVLVAENVWTDAEEVAHMGADAACDAAGIAAGGACHMAMLQVSQSHTKPKVSPMKPHSVSYTDEAATLGTSGDRAALDEEGYKQVRSLRSKHQATLFVHRLLDQMDLKVLNEEMFRGYMLSLDDASDFNGIRWMLEDQASQPCGWVVHKHENVDIDGSSAPLSEDGYRAVLELRNNYEMFRFATRVIEEEGYHLSPHNGSLHGMLAFYNCDTGSQSYGRMRDELREVASSKYGWVSRDEHFPEEDSSSAPLTEEGFMAVRDKCDEKELFNFALRVLDEADLHLSGDEGKLSGMLKFYGCEKPVQSLDAMQKELRKIAALSDGWLQPGHESNVDQNADSDSNDGSSASLTENGYKAVAERCQSSELLTFAKRIIESERLGFTGNDGELNGMLEYYNCDKVQSLERMRQELHAVASRSSGWLKAADPE